MTDHEIPHHKASYAMPPLPEGWKDATFRHDAIPSYLVGLLKVWIDHPDREARIASYASDIYTSVMSEVYGPRFLVQVENDYWGSEGPIILETDDWAEVLTLASRSPLALGIETWNLDQLRCTIENGASAIERLADALDQASLLLHMEPWLRGAFPAMFLATGSADRNGDMEIVQVLFAAAGVMRFAADGVRS